MASPFQSRNGEFGDPPRDKFGKPGVSYPTPNPDDLVIVEVIPLEKGQYKRLSYGTPHKEFTAARLISQRRTNGEDNKVTATRVYATARQSQDAYNAAISYTAQSGAHRILSRSSLVLREGYAPLADLAPDSLVPAALCTQEQATPAEEPYNTLYLRVTRVFEVFGTPAEQDAWNRRDSLPYLLATAPRITRVYRVPATYVPAWTVGATTDGATTGAVLTSVARQDESARVRLYTLVFDSFPAADQQTGLGVRIDYPDASLTGDAKITWTFRARDEASSRVAFLSACPIPGFSSARLTQQSFSPGAEGSDQALGGTVTRVYETFGTVAQQDAWNEQERTLPYLSDDHPRIVRKYRFAEDAVPTFTIGSTADTVVPAAKLTVKAVADDGVVKVITATFEDVPAAATAQNGLGWSVTYPQGAKAFPLLAWRYRVRKGDYAPADDHAACPVPGYGALVLTERGAQPAPDFPDVLVVTNEYQLLPGALLTTITNARVGRQDTQIPAKFLSGEQRITTVQIVDPLTTAPDPKSGTVLDSTVTPQNTLKATKTTVYRPDAPYAVLKDLDAVARAGQGTNAVTTSTIIDVPVGTVPASPMVDYKTLEATVVSLGDGKAIQIVASVDEWPTLASYEQDRRTRNLITISKTFVPAATAGALAGLVIGRLAGGVSSVDYDSKQTPPLLAGHSLVGSNWSELTEIQEYDKLRSIKIVSRLDLRITSRTLPVTQRYNFPNELLSINFVEASASSGTQYSWDAGLNLKIKEGYSGPCNGTINEFYVFDPVGSVTIPAITKYEPVGYNIYATYAYAVTGSSAGATANVRTFSIPPSLHGAITVPPLTSATTSTSTIPATTPTGIGASGSSICVSVPEPEDYRFGLYIVQYLTITIP